MDDIAAAVKKVVLNFIDKKEKGVPVNYATEDHRSRL
jgi:hypothetical protein